MKFNPAASCRYIRDSLQCQPLYLRIGISLLLLVTTTLFQSLFINYADFKTPFLLYFGVVILSTICCGTIPAIVTACCSAIIDACLFFQPFDNNSNLLAMLMQIAIYMLECFAFIYLSYRHAITYENTKLMNNMYLKNLAGKNAPVVALIDKSGKPVYISPSIEKLIGYTSEEVITLNYNLLYNSEDQFKIKQQFKEILAAREKQISCNYKYRHKNGGFVWIECHVTNHLDEPGIQAVLINFKNITEKIIAAEKKEEFVKLALHEITAPLNTLNSYTALIKNEASKADNVRLENITERMEMQLKKLNLLIESLSSADKNVTSVPVFSYSYFDLNDLVMEAINNTLRANGTSHTISTYLSSAKKVIADRERIFEVVNNLISSAIHSSPKGNIIKVVSKPELHSLRLEVIDQYDDSSQHEERSSFVSNFYKGHAALATNGFGLYSAAQIIREHGGNIGFDSEKGKGSTYWFTLPTEN